jgi:hypothetical protein
MTGVCLRSRPRYNGWVDRGAGAMFLSAKVDWRGQADLNTKAPGVRCGPSQRLEDHSMNGLTVPWVCPNCPRAILSDDTLVFEKGRLAHLDCRRPRALSPEERILLFAYCRGHAVAECKGCVTRFRLRELASVARVRLRELASDPISNRIHLCPMCREDLTDSVRAHLYGCALIPVDVRHRAQAAREMTQRLVKGREHMMPRIS